MATPASPRSLPATEVRALSLRTLVLGGAGVVIAALLLSFAFFARAAWGAAAERGAIATYYMRLDELTGAVGAIAATEAPQVGSAVSAPVAELLAAMRAPTAEAVAGQITVVTVALAEWRAAAAASAASTDIGHLHTLRTKDRALGAAATELRAALAAHEHAALAALDAHTRRSFVLGAIAAVLAALAGGLLLAIVVRHAVRPLSALARFADAAVPEHDSLRVAEVRQLAQAMRQLQTQGQDRQRAIEQSRARAVQLSRFAELVQGTSRPHEIRTAVATMLEGALPEGEVQLVEWNEGQTRMQLTWPQTAEAGEVELDATTCPAVRRKRPVRGEASSETACDCPFGVPEVGTYACIPMSSAGSVSGLVNIRSKKPAAWTRSDVAGAQAYVNFASSALGTIYVLQTTRDRALRDGLTGAYNRRFLDEYLYKRLADSVRHDQPLSVLLLDLDHFKTLNDTFGHGVGDRALVEFAAMVHGQIRTGDAFVRYGGEEFVLVLTSTDIEGAMIVAERIRARAEKIALEVPPGSKGTPKVTASIGVASVGEHGTSVAEILGAADRAVYRAKARGRNRVERAEPMPVAAKEPQLAAVP